MGWGGGWYCTCAFHPFILAAQGRGFPWMGHPTTSELMLSALHSPSPCPLGPVATRSQPAPEASGNTIGLEAIIRKALMGKYDEQAEERAAMPPGSGLSASAPPSETRPEDTYSSAGLSQAPRATLLAISGFWESDGRIHKVVC